MEIMVHMAPLVGSYAVMYRGRENFFANFAKLQPGRARKKYFATTYQPFFSALYLAPTINLFYMLKLGPCPKKVPTSCNKVGILVAL